MLPPCLPLPSTCLSPQPASRPGPVRDSCPSHPVLPFTEVALVCPTSTTWECTPMLASLLRCHWHLVWHTREAPCCRVCCNLVTKLHAVHAMHKTTGGTCTPCIMISDWQEVDSPPHIWGMYYMVVPCPILCKVTSHPHTCHSPPPTCQQPLAFLPLPSQS